MATDKENISQPNPIMPFGGGEMGERIRNFDWTQTPLGPSAAWPQSLKTAVRILLNSRYPMFVWWGHEFINIYNDAYITVLGSRHPAALGQTAPAIWNDVWSVVGPQAEIVFNQGQATWNESLLLIMERYGYAEETYFTFSYSPAPDDNGQVGGVFCVCSEDTRRVVGERQLDLLRELAYKATDVRTWQEACQRSAEALALNTLDLPFAMIYITDPEADTLSLAAYSGMLAGHPLAPEQINLDDPTLWPFSTALNGHDAIVVPDIQAKSERPLPTGAWEQPPTQVALIPIAATGQTGYGGVLVVGLNPFRYFDDDYRNFLTLVAGQISASIASAQAYEEEKMRAEALAELDQTKTAFFSNVSHEFRTPLTLMLGPIEQLLAEADGGLNTADREQLQVVHRNSLRLLKLVNSILDFSRIEANRLQASYEPVNLADYTAELASIFRSAIERAGLQLLINCPPLPELVYVDREMWEKIVLNLLSNAFKFTLEGEIEVRLEALADHVQLTVRDTGIGIPEAEMPHVFERFHRVQESRGRTHEGTGIGLALVDELVNLHGGTIHAESALNKGSQFIVTLPWGHQHIAPQHIRASQLTPMQKSSQTFLQEAERWFPPAAPANEEILVHDNSELISSLPPQEDDAKQALPRIIWADDNADMREYVARLLGTHFQVEAVADGQAALEAAQAHPPDLILSDIMMPRLDGYELLRSLRSDPQLHDTPIILLSARAGEEARIEGIEAGANDYLIKPFSARELLACVEAQIKLAQVRTEATTTLRQSEKQYRGMSIRLKALLEVTSSLIKTLETQELLSSLLEFSREIVNVDALAIWRMVDDEWSVVDSNGLSDEFIQASLQLSGNNTLPKSPVVVQPQELADRSATILHSRWTHYEREGIQSLLVLPLSIHGDISGTLVFYCRSTYVFTEVDIESAQALANIAASAITTAELYETQSRLRQAAEDAAIREKFLSSAGAILSASLDYEQTLANVAQIAVPHFADWCAVDILDEEGVLRRLAVSHINPQKIALAQEITDKYPARENAERGVQQVLRTGEPELMRDIPEELITSAAQDEYHLELLLQLQFRSYICVPLVVDGTVCGTITFVSAESNRPFADSDLSIAEEIARRASQAIDNARLYRELAEGEKRLRLALTAVNAGVWELNVVSGKGTWSREFQALYGYDEATPHAYEQWLSSLVAEDREQAHTEFAQLLASAETAFQQEYRIVHPQLGIRWIQDIGYIERDENGRAQRCVGISTDITERRQAEMAVRESQQRFQLMADAAPVLIWMSGTDKLCTWFNQTWLDYVGRSMEEEVGYGWRQNLHPDDYDLCLDTYNAAFDAREAFSVEYRLQGKDDEYHWMLDKGIPLYEADGSFKGYIGTCIDIHDRRLAEELLLSNAARNAFRAALADSLRTFVDPIAIQAEAARILGAYLGVNRAFYGEVTPNEEHIIIHRDYHHNVPSGAGQYRIEDFGRNVVKAFREGHTLAVNDVVNDPTLTETERTAFAEIDIRAHATACLIKEGRLIALLGVRHAQPRQWTPEEIALLEEVGDRTWAAVERARAEAALRQMNETLEERVEERTHQVRDLVSRLTMAEQSERRRISQILHDDLQQLLSAIKMKMGMIRQDAEIASDAALMEALDEGINWLDQAVQTTRQMSVDLSPPILQSEGLTQALSWLRMQMRDLHGLEIELEAQHKWFIPDENLRVLLFQIVRELLFNVKKHAGVSQVTVQLTEENGHMVIHVIDEGKGFDVEEARAREEHGFGFGLFSVRGRIQPLGGRLEIVSRPGAGTHVKVYTPVQNKDTVHNGAVNE